MNNKKKLAIATLLASITTSTVTPVAFAEDYPDNMYGKEDFIGEDCSMCLPADYDIPSDYEMLPSYCSPGSEGGPGFQDCPGCYGREGPQGTTDSADSIM